LRETTNEKKITKREKLKPNESEHQFPVHPKGLHNGNLLLNPVKDDFPEQVNKKRAQVSLFKKKFTQMNRAWDTVHTQTVFWQETVEKFVRRKRKQLLEEQTTVITVSLRFWRPARQSVKH
jgi:hypothetical protein